MSKNAFRAELAAERWGVGVAGGFGGVAVHLWATRVSHVLRSRCGIEMAERDVVAPGSHNAKCKKCMEVERKRK